MPALVHAALTLRRTARASVGTLPALAFLAVPVLGLLRPEGRSTVLALAIATMWAVWLTLRVETHRRERTDERRVGMNLELGGLVLAGAHGVVQAFGGLEGPLYPIVYVTVAFLAAFAQAPFGTILVLASIAYESLLWLVSPAFSLEKLIGHGVFILFFGVLNLVFTRVEIARVRETSKRERDAEQQRVEEDARLFRLTGAPSADAQPEAHGKLVRSSVDEVRDSLFHVLDLLKRTLELNTCILLFVEDDGSMRIVEMATDSEHVDEGPFPKGQGAVGAVATRGLVTNLGPLKPGYRGICYYRDDAPSVRAFLGVPVSEHGQLRGALCADRLEPRAFTDKEEEILRAASTQVLRILQNERVFMQLESSKREHAQLYKASRALGAALTETQVLEAGLAAAAELARFDLGAITLVDKDRRQQRIAIARGMDAAGLEGRSFKEGHSLAAMVVANKHALPYRGELDGRQSLFGATLPTPRLRSAYVLPLLVRDDCIGTLVVGAERTHAFGEGPRSVLQVLANQLAIALSNARAVKRLEEMATTDGLTGCLNKRAFLEELEAKIASAQRFGRKLSLVVTDIDHFKNVNDTYGHATGDVVIKELGAILMRRKRETDRVARFGGEEFCILCEETDTEGAVQLAERIREEMGETVFQTELGKLKVTASLGVATFPAHASSSQGLFEITDKALYAAKHAGRNRVCTVRDLK